MHRRSTPSPFTRVSGTALANRPSSLAVTVLTLSAFVVPHAALADCPDVAGSVRLLSNELPAMQAIAARASRCATDQLEFTADQTAEHKDIQVAALTSDPAAYTTAIVANSSSVPLLNADLLRPLDDLVERYGENLTESQLITIDGKVMAVAFMANAQHLFYREDVLKEAGVPVPTTYEEVLAALESIREQGLMDTPFTSTFAAGWDLGEEFVNLYLGHGGEFFESGSARPSIANEKGVATLELLKALSGYMNPDFLTFDTNAAQAEWEEGRAAMMTLWGSRAGATLDDENSTPEVVDNTVLVAAPTVAGNDIPATTLWWDGIVIAKNVDDADAEASFRVMMEGIAPALAQEEPDAAVWLIDGFEPGPMAAGVSASAAGGAKPYPMLPYMGILHTAISTELVDFMQGKESAEKALEDAETAYLTAARESGFVE